MTDNEQALEGGDDAEEWAAGYRLGRVGWGSDLGRGIKQSIIGLGRGIKQLID
ncbi:hypothetical protein PPACK8108_LOCUS19263 [Phakopsora pachyrhizi]|uniref:Uncharacterized protein n=1 Tax=Phakopsora pachyrhizi TaxID=170000 RepID=A0AAV0BCG4_PHAPC|nr:hypothetical protein PPACK8108_LOCUS19263 [Phakopsora pachyrhizi]